MRIKPEVDFRFSPPTNSSVPSGSWWSVPNLVKIGEELRTLSSGTYIVTEKPYCAADLIIYHFFAILANVIDNNERACSIDVNDVVNNFMANKQSTMTI